MKAIVCSWFLLATVLIVGAQTPPEATRITVALDGSGDYRTIQAAVNSVRDLAHVRATIYVKNGIYKEKLVIPSWKTMISLVGESREQTIITNADYTGKDYPGKDPSGTARFMTYTSYTVLVQGNDFIAENLTIENTAGRVGQAVALHVEGDRVMIKNCALLGNQDTLYAAREGSRQYYLDCIIEGTTDFIFGEATAVFSRCTIKSLLDSYITAAATRPGQAFGFVLLDCTLTADSSLHKVYLGRPWRPYAKTVFIRCAMGGHILPEGWNSWTGDKMFPEKEKTAYYGEFESTGAGGATGRRVTWAKRLSRSEAGRYTLKNIFGNWTPGTGR